MEISWRFHGRSEGGILSAKKTALMITVFGLGKPTHFDSSHIFDMSSF